MDLAVRRDIIARLYLFRWYWRVKQKGGAGRATIVLTLKLLSVICITLKTGIPYNEGCFEEWCKHSKRKRADHMINELQRLGYTVVVPE